MKIDRGNYEEFALDYLEGALEEGLRREFDEFLARNPDIAARIEALGEGMPALVPDARVVFQGREKLMKRRGHFSLLYYSGVAAAMLAAGYLISDMTTSVEPVPAPTGEIAKTVAPAGTLPVSAPVIAESSALLPTVTEPAEQCVTSVAAAAKVVNSTFTEPAPVEKLKPVVGHNVELALAFDIPSPEYEVAILTAPRLPGPDIVEPSSGRMIGFIRSLDAFEGFRMLGEFSPLRVYKNEYNERVVEFASLTLGRRTLIEKYN